MTPSLPTFRRLVGGVVAFKDGPRVGDAIRSLLAQALPPATEWVRIWVVVAPDDVGTLDAAQSAAAASDLVEVVEEPERRGKAAALAEIAARADGDLLVLLNGDAEAAPGAVAELLAVAEGAGSVFGVMARPVTPAPVGRFSEALELLWRLHDRFHREVYRMPEVVHLSDELLAFPIPALPPFRPGIITDGAFAGAWIRRQGGELRYADRARVRISLPQNFAGHLEQRRRVRVGHRAVRAEFGRTPETMSALLFSRPGFVLRTVRAETRARPGGVRSLMLLTVAEALSVLLSNGVAARRAPNDGVWVRVPLAAAPRGVEAGPLDSAG